MIIVLSYKDDRPSIEIHAALQQRGIPTLLLDTGDFPQQIVLDARIDTDGVWSGVIVDKRGERIDLSAIQSIIYRRPTHYQVSEDLPVQTRSFADNEANKGFGGVLRSLDCFWLSHPDALRAAGYKPRQLREATRLGFRIPRTLITNDAQAVKGFYDEFSGNIIYKTLHGGNIGVDEKHYDAVYTSKITPESLQHLDRVQYTAHLFQENIAKEFELRITVVGNRVFSARINTNSDVARQDFRADYPSCTYEAYQLPPDIEQKCLMLTRVFGLEYSAIDIAVTPEGEYIYFESNPAGQYHWIEYYTKLAITEAIVDLLIKGEKSV